MPLKSPPKIVIPGWDPKDPAWKCYSGAGPFGAFCSSKLVPIGTVVQVASEYFEVDRDGGLYGQSALRLASVNRSFAVAAVEAAKIPADKFAAAEGLIDNPERTYIKLCREAGIDPVPLVIDGKPCVAMKNLPPDVVALAVRVRLNGLKSYLEKHPNPDAPELIEHESGRAGVLSPATRGPKKTKAKKATKRVLELLDVDLIDGEVESFQKELCFDALRKMVEADGSVTVDPICVGRSGRVIGLALKSDKRATALLFRD
jgi:hypothetical protein